MEQWWPLGRGVPNALRDTCRPFKEWCLMENIQLVMSFWVLLFWWLVPLSARFSLCFVTRDWFVTLQEHFLGTKDHSYFQLSFTIGSPTRLTFSIRSRTWRMSFGLGMAGMTPWGTQRSMVHTHCYVQPSWKLHILSLFRYEGFTSMWSPSIVKELSSLDDIRSFHMVTRKPPFFDSHCVYRHRFTWKPPFIKT